MGNEMVLKKLVNAMGKDRGAKLMGEVLSQLGISELSSPNDRFQFGNELMRRGGVGKLLGQSIALQARLHGAR